MKITIISDNYVDAACLVAEHGFSCLIETEGKKILFDTGQGNALLNNMKHLNIKKNVDLLVFSHGHYDHTGGLTKYFHELLEYTEEVYASEHIFDKHKKKVNGGNYAYIGVPGEQAYIERHYNVHYNTEMREILPNVILSGPIKRFEDFDADALLYVRIDDEYHKDMFRDEQYVVVREESGIHVITGCTHCGAVNLLKDVAEKFEGEQILSLTGGLHLFRSDEGQVKHVIDYLKSADVKKINTGHCTGLEAAMQMQQELGDRVTITKAGLILSL
ncbi:MAG: MBL fold metallo-hydrolase [Deferribacterales bacterium]